MVGLLSSSFFLSKREKLFVLLPNSKSVCHTQLAEIFEKPKHFHDDDDPLDDGAYATHNQPFPLMKAILRLR